MPVSNIDPAMKDWIDNASYEQLLRHYRYAPVGSPYFQGETGEHYKKVMAERKRQESNPSQVSKNIGW